MTISKRVRKKVIKRAMYEIAEGLMLYSCIAIKHPYSSAIPGTYESCANKQLASEYQEFYERFATRWDPELPVEPGFNKDLLESAKEWRLTLLALFAEVGLEGIGE